MNREDIAEEHRKYLDIDDNPKRVSTSAIFKLVSDGQVKLERKIHDVKLGQARIEERQSSTDGKVEHLEVSVDKFADRLSARLMTVESDFSECRIRGTSSEATVTERLNWQDKMQKLLLSLLVFIIGFLFIIYGIPIPFP